MPKDDGALAIGALLLGGGLAGYALGRWLTPASAPPPPRNARARTHRDVEFAVDDASGNERIFKSYDEAAGFATGLSVSTGTRVHLDVLVSSRAGATWWGGDDAAETYDEDPEASVFERLLIQASSQGRVP